MTEKDQREIIIEIEMVRRIRKRAKTTLGHCRQCQSVVDFIEIGLVSQLMEVDESRTSDLIAQNALHHQIIDNSGNGVCAVSLISFLETRANQLTNGKEEASDRSDRPLLFHTEDETLASNFSDHR